MAHWEEGWDGLHMWSTYIYAIMVAMVVLIRSHGTRIGKKDIKIVVTINHLNDFAWVESGIMTGLSGQGDAEQDF